jgi:Pyruvate/2-oxoacid:ferredoxin oxidoreductase delta subunit
MYYAASLKEGLCDGCGVCVPSCPEPNALELVRLNGKAKTVRVYALRCKGCGLCVAVCPKKALEILGSPQVSVGSRAVVAPQSR